MKEHDQKWMDAYLDGELLDIQMIAFENHLNECESCRIAYESQLQLKQALQNVQPIQGSKSAEQFLAEIKMQIRTPQPKKVGIQRLIWYLVPTALILFFGAMQTYTWLTGLLSFIPGADRMIVDSLPLLSKPMEINPWLTAVIQTGIFWNGLDWLFNWNILTQLFFVLSASILYLVWMAMWMMNHAKSKQFEI